MSFSERYGYRPVRDVVQRESMDDHLRTGLWNALESVLWSRAKGKWLSSMTETRFLIQQLWDRYFKQPLDTVPEHWSEVHPQLKGYFFSCQWNEVYDFLEFVVAFQLNQGTAASLIRRLNGVLEREVAAYRFVGHRVTEITSPEEVGAIEQALAQTSAVPGVGTHLRVALDLLADRETPDYRNSIKESISAVEAIANRAAGSTGRTLADALKSIPLDLHPALDGAFKKLYGYTSDADGIRHALMDESNLEFEDAKFMLVTCSAFVNYLIAKAGRAGVAI